MVIIRLTKICPVSGRRAKVLQTCGNGTHRINIGDVKMKAKDFQAGKYFVGYEASARMSDLVRMYPDLLIIGKEGRFRTLEINWDNKLAYDMLELLKGMED